MSDAVLGGVDQMVLATFLENTCVFSSVNVTQIRPMLQIVGFRDTDSVLFEKEKVASGSLGHLQYVGIDHASFVGTIDSFCMDLFRLGKGDEILCFDKEQSGGVIGAVHFRKRTRHGVGGDANQIFTVFTDDVSRAAKVFGIVLFGDKDRGREVNQILAFGVCHVVIHIAVFFLRDSEEQMIGVIHENAGGIAIGNRFGAFENNRHNKILRFCDAFIIHNERSACNTPSFRPFSNRPN